MSLESRLKMSLARKGKASWNKGRKLTDEEYQKHKLKNLGRKQSVEEREKRSLSLKGAYEDGKRIAHFKGKDAWNKGLKFPDRSGVNSPRWKGGYENKLLHVNNRRCINNGGSHTLVEWEELKEIFNHICPSCLRSEPLIKLTRDHITPITQGGSNNIENIQPLCKSCNSVKKDKRVQFLNPCLCVLL